MAADQKSHIASVSQKTFSSPAFKSVAIDNSPAEMPHAAAVTATASIPNQPASAAVARRSSLRSSVLCRMQADISGAQAHNSIISGAATAETGTELQSSRSNHGTTYGSDDLSINTHPIHRGCCSSIKRRENHAAPLPLKTPEKDELGSMALPGGSSSSCSGKLTQTLESAGKKLHAAASRDVGSVHEPKVRKCREEAPPGEVPQGSELEGEEGCTTPTAREQRIPQYGSEVSGLVCPPAPKKRACVSKKRRLFLATNDTADQYGRPASAARHSTFNNFNSRGVADSRRAFLLDPPDLHKFPDCIRAIFK